MKRNNVQKNNESLKNLYPKRKRIPFNKLDNIQKNDDKFLENLDFTSDGK